MVDISISNFAFSDTTLQLHILGMTLRSLAAISEFKLDAHSYIQTFSAYGIPYNRYNFLLTSKSCLSEPISLENDSWPQGKCWYLPSSTIRKSTIDIAVLSIEANTNVWIKNSIDIWSASWLLSQLSILNLWTSWCFVTLLTALGKYFWKNIQLVCSGYLKSLVFPLTLSPVNNAKSSIPNFRTHPLECLICNTLGLLCSNSKSNKYLVIWPWKLHLEMSKKGPKIVSLNIWITLSPTYFSKSFRKLLLKLTANLMGCVGIFLILYFSGCNLKIK